MIPISINTNPQTFSTWKDVVDRKLSEENSDYGIWSWFIRAFSRTLELTLANQFNSSLIKFIFSNNLSQIKMSQKTRLVIGNLIRHI